MEIKLNSHILEKLDLRPSCTENELKSKLDKVSSGFLNVFHSEASKSEILNIAFNGCEDKLEIHSPIYRIEKWCYHKVTNNAREIAEVVHIPHYYTSGEPRIQVDMPPTEAEKLIVKAWQLEKEVIEDSSTTGPKLINNKVLVLWKKGEYEDLSEGGRKVLYALLHASGSETPSVCKEMWWEQWKNATNLDLSDTCCILDNRDDKDLLLLKAAFEETIIKWRFLSLYRILERGYLKSILSKIQQEFMRSPQTTISDASQLLSNECSQFVGLVRDHDLRSFFEDFATDLDILSSGMNKYAIMLKRELSEDKLLSRQAFAPGNKYVKGVLLCYKIRCSIVHAGASHLMFDEFSDADDALRSLLMPLGNAVMNYVGITMI
jgi:hypothetical protein